MAPSFIQCCAVILVIAVLQPAYLKSLTSEIETREETSQLNRIRREAAVGLANPETLVINPSPCPDGQDFCETADDYPTDHINEMIKKQPKYILDQLYTEADDYDINKFNPSAAGETPLCAASNTVVYPKKGKAKDGTFEFIVNDSDYKQGVRVEACLSQTNNNQCNIPGSLSIGYTSYCVQKHIQRTLVVVDKSSPGLTGFVTKPFEFPSCCSCVIVMTGSADRIGFSPVGSGPTNTTTVSSRT
uniref:Spaetzle domain-containing protein n=1 Tax=Cuerna arida TaxID=1464854 RepID=A0A1B6FB50_9HEMI